MGVHALNIKDSGCSVPGKCELGLFENNPIGLLNLGRQLSQVNYTALNGGSDGLGSIVRCELFHDVLDMNFHRFL